MGCAGAGWRPERRARRGARLRGRFLCGTCWGCWVPLGPTGSHWGCLGLSGARLGQRLFPAGLKPPHRSVCPLGRGEQESVCRGGPRPVASCHSIVKVGAVPTVWGGLAAREPFREVPSWDDLVFGQCRWAPGLPCTCSGTFSKHLLSRAWWQSGGRVRSERGPGPWGLSPISPEGRRLVRLLVPGLWGFPLPCAPSHFRVPQMSSEATASPRCSRRTPAA